MKSKDIYRVVFYNQGKVYEVHARRVSTGGMFGFVEMEELIFGERSELIVDPSEERLKEEFAGVRKTYLPMHAVIRIDEVEKEGVNKISTPTGDNVTPFPLPVYPPGSAPKKP
jgi:hypothetical protein